MITVEEAESIIERHMPPLTEATVRVQDPRLLKLAEPLLADRAYPAIHRITMDGIAVSFEQYASGVKSFPIAGICAAGSPEQMLSSQAACMEVMTGSALPSGADFVIPYEHLDISSGIANLKPGYTYQPFDNIHRQGSDFAKGDCLLESGATMHGPHWGIAASLGYAQLKCKKALRIKVISTGDELVDVDQTPLAHQIRRSNSYALKASLTQNGYLDVELGHLRDNEDEIAREYERDKWAFDLLIYSGGVSKGRFDFLPKVWECLGVQKYFHEVSQRPGKPLWFGVDSSSKTAVLGLPGNPLSSLICLHRYLLRGRPLYGRLNNDIYFAKDLTYFLPAKVACSPESLLMVSPIVPKNSGEFSALAGSDGFIELPRGRNHFRAGENFRFFPWTNLWGGP